MSEPKRSLAPSNHRLRRCEDEWNRYGKALTRTCEPVIWNIQCDRAIKMFDEVKRQLEELAVRIRKQIAELESIRNQTSIHKLECVLPPVCYDGYYGLEDEIEEVDNDQFRDLTQPDYTSYFEGEQIRDGAPMSAELSMIRHVHSNPSDHTYTAPTGRQLLGFPDPKPPQADP